MKQLSLITGQTKEEIAIDFIREHEPPEGYFLGFSGGKDSVVLYDLTVKAGVTFKTYYSATGIDPPEVVRFINEHYPDVIHKHPEKSFFAYIPEKGYPGKWSRWCCDKLKKHPTKHIPLGKRLMGIRAEESFKRSKRPMVDKFSKKITIYKPIFYWLEWEIWDHIDSNHLPYCSLYDEGFDRLGCVICPFICHGRNGVRLKMHMNRWPKHYKAFEKAMKKLFDNYLCVVNPRSGGMNYRRETDFETFLNNWYKGE